ncbi:kinase-like protein [Trichoderma citrinoviride]|uniref:Kinase-like protein n=1 Tax=Trichoderma citrinoviride TaxID=58853 RepID=A0A2T4B775_9HYPO|nr:kinase-like protein [Trichoderma citrinoviride]PTB65182.1 kinase-like protein [Trichoderma citrinoviride]
MVNGGSTPGRPVRLIARLREAFVINPCDNDKQFIPCGKLRELCNEQAVTQELVRAFPKQDAALCQLRARLICHGQAQDGSIIAQPCLRIFTILVLLGQVRLIETFLKHGLCDNDLPFSSTPRFTELYSPQRQYATHLDFPDEDDPYRIIKSFFNDQWSVLAPCFTPPTNEDERCDVHDLHTRAILPIEEISKKQYPGGFGLVEKVKIHRDHNGFKHDYFALKTMHPMTPDERERFFQQELDAFHQARPGGHIIEICAAFKKGEKRGFLFPWADGGTLNHLWRRPPHEIVKSAGVKWPDFSRWICEQCYGIIHDLFAIHEPYVLHATNEEDLYGIHGDIKPDNVLYFTQDGSPLGTLKVSDLGLMKFHRLISRTAHSKSMGFAYQTYRAPEHDLNKVRSRKIDIWAFGCLFAEFATWAMGGHNAIELFKTYRLEEDKGNIDESKGEWSEDNFFILKNRIAQNKVAKRKSSVDAWFTVLIKDLGPDMANSFFPDFLRFIQNSMLDPDRKRRADCKMVESFLNRLLTIPPDDSYWNFPGTRPYPNGGATWTSSTGTPTW